LKFANGEKLVLPLEAEDYSQFRLESTKYIPQTRAYIQEWLNGDERITIIQERKKHRRVCQLEVAMREMARLMYPGSEFTLNTVQKTKGEIILISEAPNGHQEISPFTTITRHLMTPNCDQYIVFEKRNGTLTDEEKEAWVEKLKQAYVSNL